MLECWNSFHCLLLQSFPQNMTLMAGGIWIFSISMKVWTILLVIINVYKVSSCTHITEKAKLNACMYMNLFHPHTLFHWILNRSVFTEAGLNLVEGDIVLDEVCSWASPWKSSYLSAHCILTNFWTPLTTATEAIQKLHNRWWVQMAEDCSILHGGRPW